VTDFTSAKNESFSKAHRPRHPAGVDGDSPEYFSHSVSSSTDESRRARQGDGLPRDQYDPKYFSDFTHLKGVVKPTDVGRPVERDAEGHPAFSETLSAVGHDVADRIRRNTR
jgi:hypothetical protein